jgi:hypothetical protein
MASATVTLSNRLKYDILRKRVDFSADNIKALLCRGGFVFDKDNHHTKQQFNGYVSLACSFYMSTINCAAGGLSGYFLSGQAITGSGNTSYAFSYLCTSATDSILYFTGSASWLAGTSATLLTIQDEVASGNGYSRDATYISGISIGEDDTSDLISIMWATNLSWTATGGSIGNVAGIILIDDTWSAVIGYISLASAEMVAVNNALVISGVTIRLT